MNRLIILFALTAPISALAGDLAVGADEPPKSWTEQNTAAGSEEIDPREEDDPATYTQLRHGFRVGYTYANTELLDSPHVSLMGYEAQQTMVGGGSVNVIFVENALIAGLNQSMLVPTFNVLAGVEIRERLHMGVGVNLSFTQDKFDRIVAVPGMISAMGVTLPVDDAFEVPVNLSWTSEPDGYGRLGITTGINWKQPKRK